MRVLVLVKCVPDTETRVKLAADGRSIDDGDVKWIVSPYDEFALEEGLRIVEKAQAGEVTVLSLGDDRVQPVLRGCLALGAARVVFLNHAAFQGGDGLATSRALAAAARTLGFDLILAGKQGAGRDQSQVGPMVAERLDIPHVSLVTKVEIADGNALCEREVEGGKEIVETSLPALLTAQKGLNEPRYAGLKGIMAAKKKPIDAWGPAEVGIDPAQVGVAGSGEQWTRVELPAPRAQGQILKGEPAQVARELVRLLSEEAKVI